MCGIIGYVGKDNCIPILINGLKRLEYRGYDSVGISIIENNGIKTFKKKGKIKDFIVQEIYSNIGIGHTRWATHGGVTVQNAHPHLDCTGRIAILHNGIIENWQEIKEDLLKKGHKFVSETDTEVFPHLLEDLEKTNDFSTAFRLAFNKIKGLNAIVGINSETSEGLLWLLEYLILDFIFLQTL